MNDFQPTQILKYGDEEYPIYDLNTDREFVLCNHPTPPEIPEQIAANIKRIPGRVEPTLLEQVNPVAIVGFGPTLRATWEQVQDFRNIISTSGAHKFLVDRDIIPTYHVDLDFRKHKAVHTKESHPDVDYLFASIVHSETLDNVEGKRVKLWHVDIPGVKYPEGEFVAPGYWDVGQEAILIAKALGYRTMHLFGFDYAYEVGGTTHAAAHNGPKKPVVFANVGNRIYQTSDDLCRGVLSFTQLLKDNADISITLHGDGMLGQYLQKHYV